MQRKRRYTLCESKLAMAYYEGFTQSGDTLFAVCNANNEGRHFVIFNRFRSYERGTKWGRFHCRSQLFVSSMLKIYAFAVDAKETEAEEWNCYFHDSGVSWAEKRTYFEQNGIQYVNHEDVLLYTLVGEYLWIAVEIDDGEINKGSVEWIKEMFLDSQGDNFMWTFPEIYQSEGGFFHRYMSIFSSMYQDMSDQIANMEKAFDLDTTPIEVLLELAGWLGFAVERDFLDEFMLRSLIKEIYALNRIKGTKEVIRKLIKLALGEEAVIVERNRLEGCFSEETRETYQRLYGTSIQDVTILLKRSGSERLQAQMIYLLNQFKPARSHIRLVFCPSRSSLDTYCYLDYNAVLSVKGEGSMDDGIRMNGTSVLK